MPTKIQEIQVIAAKDLVENERKRLLALKESKSEWWENKNKSDWARGQFGENLIEKDGFTHRSGRAFDDHMCQICGEFPDREEKFIQLIFSFCDEYGCDMNICRKCLGVLQEKLGENPEQGGVK